jgi:hypothetical protein
MGAIVTLMHRQITPTLQERIMLPIQPMILLLTDVSQDGKIVMVRVGECGIVM